MVGASSQGSFDGYYVKWKSHERGSYYRSRGGERQGQAEPGVKPLADQTTSAEGEQKGGAPDDWWQNHG
jgi:hypothetical protein